MHDHGGVTDDLHFLWCVSISTIGEPHFSCLLLCRCTLDSQPQGPHPLLPRWPSRDLVFHAPPVICWLSSGAEKASGADPRFQLPVDSAAQHAYFRMSMYLPRDADETERCMPFGLQQCMTGDGARLVSKLTFQTVTRVTPPGRTCVEACVGCEAMLCR